MSHVLHVFRKDVRRLRWAIAAWIAVVIGREIVRIAGPALSFESIGLQIAGPKFSDARLLAVAAAFEGLSR